MITKGGLVVVSFYCANTIYIDYQTGWNANLTCLSSTPSVSMFRFCLHPPPQVALPLRSTRFQLTPSPWEAQML